MKATLLVCAALVTVATAQPPLTSDLPPYPGRAPVFQPPNITVGVRWVTNERPIVVEQTVMSNVVQVTHWYNNGVLHTNESLLASNVVSRTTNTVITP